MSEFAEKIKSWIKEYRFSYTKEEANSVINELIDRQVSNELVFDKNSIINCIDLDTTTTLQSVKSLEQQLMMLNEIPIGAPDIASVVVAPAFCKDFGEALKSSQTKTCTVLGSPLPSYIEVLVAEAGLAKMDGTSEFEMHLSAHHYFDDQYDELFDSIAEIKNIAPEIILKTRINIDHFPSLNDLAKIAILALEAGANGISLISNTFNRDMEIATFVVADAMKKFDLKANSSSMLKVNGLSSLEEVKRVLDISNHQRELSASSASQFRIGTTSLSIIM